MSAAPGGTFLSCTTKVSFSRRREVGLLLGTRGAGSIESQSSRKQLHTLPLLRPRSSSNPTAVFSAALSCGSQIDGISATSQKQQRVVICFEAAPGSPFDMWNHENPHLAAVEGDELVQVLRLKTFFFAIPVAESILNAVRFKKSVSPACLFAAFWRQGE